MARILLIANSTWNLQHFRYGLMQELIRRGHNVSTVSPDEFGVSLGSDPLPHRTWAMERSSTNPLTNLRQFLHLFKIIIGEAPEVVLTFTIKPNIYGCATCRLLNIRAIPNITGLGTSFLGNRFLRSFILHLYRFTFAKTSEVFFQNSDDQHLFLTAGVVQSGKSKVIPGSGINLEQFSATAPVTKDVTFLMLSRLIGDKGVREFVAAAGKVKRSIPSAKFMLVGELDSGNSTAISNGELSEWIESGVVDYEGPTADVRPFIRDATVVVLPSYREGLPRSLLEAAAMGRPLIGSDVPGCRELVRDGITGFLCRVQDVESLATAMERFARLNLEEQRRMGASARRMAENEFGEELVIREYLEAIDRAIGESSHLAKS